MRISDINKQKTTTQHYENRVVIGTNADWERQVVSCVFLSTINYVHIIYLINQFYL